MCKVICARLFAACYSVFLPLHSEVAAAGAASGAAASVAAAASGVAAAAAAGDSVAAAAAAGTVAGTSDDFLPFPFPKLPNDARGTVCCVGTNRPVPPLADLTPCAAIMWSAESKYFLSPPPLLSRCALLFIPP